MTPSGTETFSDGPDTLATTPLLAIFSTSALGLGGHTIVATYSGDDTFEASKPPNLTELVGRSSVSATLSAAPSASTYGQDATLSATMTATTAGRRPAWCPQRSTPWLAQAGGIGTTAGRH